MSDAPPPLIQPSHQATPPPQKSGGSKWAAGCGIGCLAFIILLVVGGLFAFNFAKGKVEEFIAENTTTEQVAIADPDIPQAVVDDAITRYDAFSEAMTAGETAPPLILTAEEINALIYHHPKFEALAGMTKVSIEGEQISAQLSVDFDRFEIPIRFIDDAVAGRYFSGDIALRLVMIGDSPAAFLEGLSIGGNAIPDEILNSVKTENLLKEANTDPEMKKVFEKIETLKVENGQLILVPKAAAR